MAQIRSFTKDRWCFHVGPIQIIWMRRPMVDKVETLIHISWLRRAVSGSVNPND
jgi:hypothetical protein